MASEVTAGSLGEEWKGYGVQSVVEMQASFSHEAKGILIDQGELERVNTSLFVDATLSVLNLVIREKERGLKRTSKIQKLFNLSEEDGSRQYVCQKLLNIEDEKPRTKVPKIQRPRILQHKCIALKKQHAKEKE